MNYPPPHRPGPYGPPGAGGFPPPQPPQPPPSTGGFPAQQPGGYGYGPPPGGGYGYQGGPPPKKSNTGLIVGVILAIVLVAGGAVAVTGFWQPGFFLSDEKTGDPGSADPENEGDPPPGGTGQQQPSPGGTGDEAEINRIAQVVVDGLNKRDAETVKAVSCAPELEKQEDYDNFPEGVALAVNGSPKITGEKATMPFEQRNANGETRAQTLYLQQKDGKWCANTLK